MEIRRFALGMRAPAGRMPGEEFASLFLRGLEGCDLAGLTLWGGEEEGVFTLVLMGGGLKRMRGIYRRILENREFTALLMEDMPFIENNRVARLGNMAEYPVGA